jgi:hypothetical protein
MNDEVKYLYDVDRFKAKVNIKSNDGCHEWNAAKQQFGYGMFNLYGKGIPAHRASYMLFVGNIPEGHEIDHICQNKACVRPDHLRALTPQEHVVITKLNRKARKCSKR